MKQARQIVFIMTDTQRTDMLGCYGNKDMKTPCLDSLAEKHYKIRESLHDRILDWMNRTRDPFRGYYWERRPWRKDASPATWEYTGMTRQRENGEYEPRQLDYATGVEMVEAVRKKA